MSRIIIYLGLPSPAASSDLPESRPGKPVALCLVLLRMGFTCAPSVTRRAVVSYTAFPPLPGIPRREALSADGGAVYFYCTGLGVTSTGRYPASCPAKPGLSSPGPFRSCQPRSFILLDTNVILTQQNQFVNNQKCLPHPFPSPDQTSKQPPPINSLRMELWGTASAGIPTK